ncbi:GNAT family N-acetyltransferase [Ilumatobacter coccineus]|uniref:BioF2-like acetyltransferase domain-containing protein n=1 Tax=Ilumatobacter coccineus (strain NBRC 103263 / KCTC 29153 / YM16-304) TaxID=1313172 RepID=A0A6C7E0E0_ILUCY|nr:GNAT family N-acetyltransferase [Ilumatobacter coccineus]BAN01754.1 hypothetical protein YM304_14400 [Ilumatobacter coccineus YM16-304]
MVKLIRDVDTAWWTDVAKESPAATFFHTPIWQEIAVSSFRADEAATVGFELDSGVRAVLPAVATKRLGPLRKLTSTAEGCYGGLIATGPVSAAELDEIAAQVLGRTVLAFDYLESPLPGPAQLSDGGKGWSVDRDEPAWVIDLDEDFEQVFSGFQKRLREHYRSGLRKGVTIAEATTVESYRTHFDAYRDAVDRWGEDDGYGYGWTVFETIQDLATRHPENIKLWLISVDGEPVGGRLVFYWNQHATLWHGSARREFLNHQVMPVADVDVARDAAARGYKFYDLNTTGDHPGVVRYKQRFNTREVPLRYWSYVSPAMRSIRGVRELGEAALGRVRARGGQEGGAGSSTAEA